MNQHKNAKPIADLLNHILMTQTLFTQIDQILAGHSQDNPRVLRVRDAVQNAIERGKDILPQGPQ